MNNSTEQRKIIIDALKTIDNLKEKLAKFESINEPIAIVSAACRFPGNVNNLTDYWNLLANGQDGITLVPENRWSNEDFYNADYEAKGKIVTQYGGFLTNPYLFDAEFFGISPLEASQLDPQQRLLLTVSWEAFENAGMPSTSLNGKNGGVYIGIGSNDYGNVLINQFEEIDAYVASGNSLSMASGRLSYFYGLTGPSLAIDTACSSSLVAIHQACQALHLRECDFAIAGGVNCILSPGSSINFSRAKMLSRNRCGYIFDERAEGYIRGEGCGLIIIKRLSDAIENRDPIMAVILGSAVNQDGKTSGITAPNGPAQEQVIHDSLKKAKLTPNDILYLEAHGTGTKLGDPIEANALSNIFNKTVRSNKTLSVGSVKANLGHLEAAAGVAGLIKSILILQYRSLPPQPNFEKLNSLINWSDNHIKVNKQLQTISNDQPLFLGVSSFGFSGTNSHLTIAEAPIPEDYQFEDNKSNNHIFIISAKSKWSLFQLIKSYQEFISQYDDSDTQNISINTNINRDQFAEFIALTGRTLSEIKLKLQQVTSENYVTPPKNQEIIFDITKELNDNILTNGHSLKNNSQTYHKYWNECQTSFKYYFNSDLEEKNETLKTQKAGIQEARIFACYYSMIKSLISWGIIPNTIIITHNSLLLGLTIANVISLDHAFAIIADRDIVTDNFIHDSQYRLVFSGKISDTAREYSNNLIFQDEGDTDLLSNLNIISLKLSGQDCKALDFEFWIEEIVKLVNSGIKINWQEFYNGIRYKKIILPNYQFYPHNYVSKYFPAQSLLKTRPNIIIKEIEFSLERFPFLAEHKISDTIIVPASLIFETLLTIGKNIFGSIIDIVNIKFVRPIVISETADTYLASIENIDGDRYKVCIYQNNSNLNNKDRKIFCTAKLQKPVNSPIPSTDINVLVKLPHEFDVELFYEKSFEKGIELGATFQCINKIKYDDQNACGWISTIDLQNVESFEVHPVLLDAAIQVTGIFHYKNSEGYVFSNLEKYKFYAKWTDTVFSHAKIQESSNVIHEDLIVDIKVYDQSGKLLLELLGAHFKKMHTTLLETQEKNNILSQLYKTNWVKRASFACRERSFYEGSISNLTQNSLSVLEQNIKKYQLESYLKLREQLELACVKNLIDTFETLGLILNSGQEYSVTEIVNDLKIDSRQTKLFNRIIEILVEEKLLHRDKDYIRVEYVNKTENNFQKLKQEYPENLEEIQFFEKCLISLASVLTGNTNPLEILFATEQLEGTESVYVKSPISQVLNLQIANYIQEIIKSKPSHIGTKILEIGAGTGGSTEPLLPIFNDEDSEYTFTDISKLFLKNAREKFKKYKFLKYTELNIELDPQKQGYLPHSYDCIVAANVLHATRNLQETIQHVHQLLLPGGMLILRECIKMQRTADLTFGMTEGWWRFDDYTLRPEYPLLNENQWRDLLAELGFQEIEITIPASNAAEAVIVARKSYASLSNISTVKNWVIISNSVNEKQQITNILHANGQHGYTIDISDNEHQISKNEFVTSLNSESNLINTLLLINKEIDIDYIVYLSSDGHQINPESPVEIFKNQYRASLIISKAIGIFSRSRENMKVWFVSKDAISINDGDKLSGLHQSSLWGIAKVFTLEFPFIWGGIIDMSLDAATSEYQQVYNHILYNDNEDKQVIRNKYRYIPRLERSTDVSSTAAPALGTAALITGGLGQLGYKTAQWLIENNVSKIILFSRSINTQDKANMLQYLESSGASVYVIQGDVAIENDVKSLFNFIKDNDINLETIIHTAGIGGDQSIVEISPQEFDKIIDPKIFGTWYLHLYSMPYPIKNFVIYSSMVSVWGAKDKAQYVLANNFVDTFAHYRQLRNLPCLSINWGPIGGGGMLNSSNLESSKQLGVSLIDSNKLPTYLPILLSINEPQILFATIDWKIFKELFEARSSKPFFERVDNIELDILVPLDHSNEAQEFKDQYLSLNEIEQHELIKQIIEKELRLLLRLGDENIITFDTGFFDLGMDSLLALSFSKRLNNISGLAINTTTIFNCSTINSLNKYLNEQLQKMYSTNDSPINLDSSYMATPILYEEKQGLDSLSESILQELESLETMV